MILCCKPSFVLPARRFLSVLPSRRWQLPAASSSTLSRSCVRWKLKSSPCCAENWTLKRDITYLTLARSQCILPVSEASRNLCRENYHARYYSNEVDEKKEPVKKLTLFQRFKQMYKEYWYVLVPVHLVTSCFWFGSFYYLAESGVDVVALLQTLGVGETLIEKLQKGNGTMGYLAIASAMYKIATPARYAVTLGGTTLSINYLKDWGYIKPIPPPEKIKEMIGEKKDILREKRENIKGFYKDKLKKSDER